MNVSYEWLKELARTDRSATELRELITAHVATVDDLVPLRHDIASIVVARVVEEAPHPDSDHLHVTKVDMGSGELLGVVCGAPNVVAGKLYPFAPTGTVMPNGLKIERRKIRGVVSNGMLCSPSELGLGTDGNGLLELEVDAAPGTPLLSVLPIGDTRIVIDVGANRPDLLSHLGVAREIAAITGAELRIPGSGGRISDPVAAGSPIVGEAKAMAHGPLSQITGAVTIRVEDRSLVRRFMGVVIRGLTVGPSPDWLRERIEAVGGRSINNVVDASNFVLHELGQPTHAFDLAKLNDSAIVVRAAGEGERIVTLDGHERVLPAGTIVIGDSQRAQAIAGIMGGRESEVSETTRDIFLEVANFDPGRIRTARRALGIGTDASYRFERGVDVEIAPLALRRVAALVEQLAGGVTDGAPADIRTAPVEDRTITLRAARVGRVLGDDISMMEIATLLRSLGFGIAIGGSADILTASVPSWRGDVRVEVDLIEEIARLRGYDSFPDEIRPFRPGTVPDDPQWLASRRVRECLVAAGLLETRPMPFVAGGEGFVRVANPLAENEAFLRREIVDTLARRAELNLAHMEGDVRIFEIGSVFRSSGTALPVEELHAGALIMGRRAPRHFTDPKSENAERRMSFDAWDARWLAESVAGAAFPGLAVEVVTADPAFPAYDEHAVAMPEGSVLWSVLVDGEVIGRVGEVSLDAPVWASEAWGIELSLGLIDSAQVAPPGRSVAGDTTAAPPMRAVQRYRPLPATPASTFDLALSVPRGLSAGAVEAVVRRAAGEILESLELFDLYEGPGVEPGHRSLAWRLTFRHPERTLRDKEIDARRGKILGALESELNVRHRTS